MENLFNTSFTVDSFRGYWILMLKGYNTTVICKRLILLNYAKTYPRRKELTKKTIVLIIWPLSFRKELKGIEFLPQTQIFEFLYLRNL